MKAGKKEIIRNAFGAMALGTGVFLSMGWPFFRLCTYAGRKKSKSRKTYGRKWFRFRHTTINHPRYRYEKEYEAVRTWCESQTMQDWYVRSVEGLKLHASFLPAEEPKRFVILCHGYRGSRFGSMARMARCLHENHCSLLMIDQRCCGDSEGDYITFGAREQYDVLEWIGRLQEENKDGLPIYLYGQSMGATTIILASGHALPEEVKGLIAESGFHSMRQQLRDIAAGWFHFKWIGLILLRVDLFCRIFAGFSMKETDTTLALKKNKRPILFLHGKEDTYVWPENTVLNHRICRAEKELLMIPGARHLCCCYAEPKLCEDKMMEFFRKYDDVKVK